jgi:selenide, water dikinase
MCAFFVAQHWRTYRAGNVVHGIFCGRSHVYDVVVICKLCYGYVLRVAHDFDMTESIKLTQYSHGGGCGCKIAPSVLTEILAALPRPPSYANLLVGSENSDDAAVYKLNESQAIVVTTDFFMPIVDDARDFGRIAATNALSDVYAMGATPILALAVVGMPVDKLPLETIQEILAGGASVCEEACIPLAGGHSIDTPEPIYGLAAVGLVHPGHVKRNDKARAGDVLILGKPLGVGILSAALKKGELDNEGYRQMLQTTTQLNRVGIHLAAIEEVHAMTDVTGFALLGHLLEICRGSQLSAELRFANLPILPAALQLVQQGYSTGAAERNWKSFGATVDLPDGFAEWQRKLLCDPQTSGGLLVACAPSAVKEVLAAFHATGFASASIIGEIKQGDAKVAVN